MIGYCIFINYAVVIFQSDIINMLKDGNISKAFYILNFKSMMLGLQGFHIEVN